MNPFVGLLAIIGIAWVILAIVILVSFWIMGYYPKWKEDWNKEQGKGGAE